MEMTGNKHLRIGLLASMIATVLALPAAHAGAPLETRPATRTTPAAEDGARLIVRYRDAGADRALKLQAVDAAARRAHGGRIIRTQSDARRPPAVTGRAPRPPARARRRPAAVVAPARPVRA